MLFKWYYIYRSVILLFPACVVFLSPTPSIAKTEIVYASYKYVMGDNDTKNDAKHLCFLEAKRRCLEKVGSYVESLTEVQDYKLTKDEIRSYTSAIVKVEVVSEKISFEGESVVVNTRVKAEVDTDHTKKELEKIRKDKALQARIKKQQNQIESLEGKIRTLQTKLDSSSHERSFKLREQRNQTFDDLYVETERMRKIILAKRARDAKRPNLITERTKNRRLVLRYVEIGMTVEEVAGVIREITDFPTFLENKDKKYAWSHSWDRMHFCFVWDDYLSMSVLSSIRYTCKMHMKGQLVPYLKDKNFNVLEFDFDKFEREALMHTFDMTEVYKHTMEACDKEVRAYIWGEE